MTDNYSFGNKLSLLRREKGLTGEQFAELLGVSPQAVSKWENGKNLPETALLPKLARTLGTSIDALLMPERATEASPLVRSAYVYIPVSDVQRAADWYEFALGLRVTHTDAAFTELGGAGVRVTLIPVEQSSAVHPQMIYRGMVQASFGFTVSDYAEAQERLRKAGAELTETINYVGLSCKFYDPDGNAIEIWSDYPPITSGSDADPGALLPLSPRIVRRGELTVTGISGDGSSTAEVWSRFDALYKRKPFAKTGYAGWELRFYDGNKPAPDGADVHVGYEAVSAEHCTSVTLPESEYVVFDVPVASGYESRNSVMNTWLADNAHTYAQRMLDGVYYAVERYGEKFSGGDPGSVVEIWIPLVKK